MKFEPQKDRIIQIIPCTLGNLGFIGHDDRTKPTLLGLSINGNLYEIDCDNRSGTWVPLNVLSPDLGDEMKD